VENIVTKHRTPAEYGTIKCFGKLYSLYTQGVIVKGGTEHHQVRYFFKKPQLVSSRSNE